MRRKQSPAWQVTAVDFSATSLAHARSTAEALGADVADRVDWVEGDLTTWTPQPGRYNLVACLYVRVAGSVEEVVRRIAAEVAPGGTLFLVGHRPIDRRVDSDGIRDEAGVAFVGEPWPLRFEAAFKPPGGVGK